MLTFVLSRVSTVELWYLHQADWEHAVQEAENRLRSDEACHQSQRRESK